MANPWEPVEPPDVDAQPNGTVDVNATAAAIARDKAGRKRATSNAGWANIRPGGKDRYTREERQQALQQVYDLMTEQGYSKTKALQSVADELGLRSPRTIDFWAQDFGYVFPVTADARRRADPILQSMEAIAEYNQERRLKLSDMLFAAVEKAVQVQLAAPVPDADIIRNLAWSKGILTDKRRLEEGKPTTHDLQETRDASQLLQAGQERLRVMRGGAT